MMTNKDKPANFRLLEFKPNPDLTVTTYEYEMRAWCLNAFKQQEGTQKGQFKKGFTLTGFAESLHGIFDIDVSTSVSSNSVKIFSLERIDGELLSDIAWRELKRHMGSRLTSELMERNADPELGYAPAFNESVVHHVPFGLQEWDALDYPQAYNLYQLPIISQVAGHEIELPQGHSVTFRSVREFGVSQYATFIGELRRIGTDNPHAYKLTLSLQTKPPYREPVINVHLSTLSAICKPITYARKDIHAYVELPTGSYRRVALIREYGGGNATWKWDDIQKETLKTWHNVTLPDANEYVANPSAWLSESSEPRIVSPHTPETRGNTRTRTQGRGIASSDRDFIMSGLRPLLADLATPVSSPEKVGMKHLKKLHAGFKPLDNMEDPVFNDARISNRKRLHAAVGRDTIVFEIWHKGSEKRFAQQAAGIIRSYLGPEGHTDYGTILIELRRHDLTGEVGGRSEITRLFSGQTTTGELPTVKYLESIGALPGMAYDTARELRAAIVIIPGQSGYAANEEALFDPKESIRAAFAQSDRLTQFLTTELPDDVRRKRKKEDRDLPATPEEIVYKTDRAVADLLRQLGFLFEMDEGTIPSRNLYGLALARTLLAPYKGSRTYLPVLSSVDYHRGVVRMASAATRFDFVRYWEHELAFAKTLLTDEDDRKGKADRTSYWQHYCNKKTKSRFCKYMSDDISQLVQLAVRDSCGDGIIAVEAKNPMRSHALLGQISDTGIYGNEPVPGCDEGMTWVRIRTQVNEVPDYVGRQSDKFEENKPKYKSVSGICTDGEVFYVVPPKPKNTDYDDALNHSRAASEKLDFKHNNMHEYFPIGVEDPEEARAAIISVNKTRQHSVQTLKDGWLGLPLPIQLIESMEEYCWKGVKELKHKKASTEQQQS